MTAITLLSPDLGWQNPRWFLFLRRSRNSPGRWPRELPIAWIKQPLKGARQRVCSDSPDANKSKKCHSHAGIPSAPGQDSEHESESSTLVSFMTVSTVFMTASYLPASQRRRLDCDSSKVWNHLDTGWSNNKIQTSTTSSHDSHSTVSSILGDHLAGDEQSWHKNSKSKGFDGEISVPCTWQGSGVLISWVEMFSLADVLIGWSLISWSFNQLFHKQQTLFVCLEFPMMMMNGGRDNWSGNHFLPKGWQIDNEGDEVYDKRP